MTGGRGPPAELLAPDPNVLIGHGQGMAHIPEPLTRPALAVNIIRGFLGIPIGVQVDAEPDLDLGAILAAVLCRDEILAVAANQVARLE